MDIIGIKKRVGGKSVSKNMELHSLIRHVVLWKLWFSPECCMYLFWLNKSIFVWFNNGWAGKTEKKKWINRMGKY